MRRNLLTIFSNQFLVISSVIFFAIGATQVLGDQIHQQPGVGHAAKEPLEISRSKSDREMRNAIAEARQRHNDNVERLLELAKSMKIDQSYLGPRHQAIMLLGDWRERQAVGILTESLTYVPDDYMFEGEVSDQQLHVAAVALVKIGRPSIGHMIRKIRNGKGENSRSLAAWVLQKILGKELAISKLSALATKVPEASHRANSAIRYVEEFEPTYKRLKRAVNKTAGEEIYDIEPDSEPGRATVGRGSDE